MFACLTIFNFKVPNGAFKNNGTSYVLLVFFFINQSAFSQVAEVPKFNLINPKSLTSSLSNVCYSGNLSLEEGYGVFPYSYQNSASFYSKSEGNMGLELGILPVNISYSYSSNKNYPGLGNYFRVSFDKARFLKNQLKLQMKIRDSLENKILATQKIRQDIIKRKLELYQKIQNPGYDLDYTNKLPGINNFKAKISDSLETKIPDSLGQDQFLKELKFKIEDAKIDSAELLSKIKERKIDTTEVSKLRNKYNNLEDSLKTIQKEIEILKNKYDTFKPGISTDNNDYVSKITPTKINFLEGLKQLDFGLCYPTYSTFLIANTALKGLSVEWEQDKLYFAGSIGKTINNSIAFSNNPGGRKANNNNMFDFLNYSDVSSGRNIVAVKAGYGKKEGTHLYAGVLWGEGNKTVYSTGGITANSSDKEKNKVFEIDGKLSLTKNLALDLVLSKSLIYDDVSNSSDYSTEFTSGKKNFNMKNYAIQSKIKYNLDKYKLICTATMRWIGPYFKSFGLGFVSYDNLRYELKSEKQFGKKYKLALYIRNDAENQSGFIASSTEIRTIGITGSAKLKNNLQLKLNMQPVYMRERGKDLNTGWRNSSLISNFGLTYLIRSKKSPSSINIFYSVFKMTNNNLNTYYKTLSGIWTLNKLSGINGSYMISVNEDIGEESQSSGRILIQEVTAGIALSKKLNFEIHSEYLVDGKSKSLGGGIKTGYCLTKYLDLILIAQKSTKRKLYYDSSNAANITPSEVTIKLKVHWQ